MRIKLSLNHDKFNQQLNDLIRCLYNSPFPDVTLVCIDGQLSLNWLLVALIFPPAYRDIPLEKTKIILLPHHSLREIISLLSPMEQKTNNIQEKGQEDGLNHAMNTNVPLLNSAHIDKPEIVEDTHLKLDPLGNATNHIKEECIKVEAEKATENRENGHLFDGDIDIKILDKDWIPCSECDKRFYGKRKLYTHFWSAHKNPSKCTICGAFFSSEKKTRRHMKDLHPDGPLLMCNNCRKSCKTPKNLRIHMITCRGIKPGKAQSRRQPKCGYCLAVFSYSDDLTRHNETEHTSLPTLPW